jgi:hypothetical protein
MDTFTVVAFHEHFPPTTYVLPRAVAEDCDFFKCSLSQNSQIVEIPIKPGVRPCVMEKIVEFLEFRFKHPEKKANMDALACDRTDLNKMDDWDREFIEKMDIGTLMRVVCASNFLNIPSLFMLSKKQVAKTIRSCKTDELEAKFKIPDDSPAHEYVV